MMKYILVGLGAALLLILLYLGIISLAQGINHAFTQTRLLWYWVLALASGFGIQAGLYFRLRLGIKGQGGVSTASVATSGGVSAGSMAACCAHHLSDVLPLLGLAGLSIFLVRYQVFFIVAGLLSNIVGTAIMLDSIQRHHPSSSPGRWRLDMGKVKKVALITAPLILVLAFFLT